MTSPSYAALPKNASAVRKSNLPERFKNVLSHFAKRNVGLIVRLNSELYSSSYFTALGINHLDMIFDDGTCPPLPMVKKFIKLAHDMISVKHKAIAVHCKAGLGRTGCLIGAYLIYRHGFTANEVIAFMRFMRPGMVVGPQQHWLHLNQGTFREWWWEDTMKEKLALVLPSTPTKTLRYKHDLASNGQTATPPNGSQQGSRSALGEMNSNHVNSASNAIDEILPAPTPGQPRKGSRVDARHHPYSRTTSAAFGVENEVGKPENEIVEARSHRQNPGQGASGGEEEWEMRMVSRQTSSGSPVVGETTRTVSYTTSMTRNEKYSAAKENASQPLYSDIENCGQTQTSVERASQPKGPVSSRSGNGSGTLGISKMRSSPVRKSAESREVKGGVRKTSGRVGSVGTTAASRSRS